MEPLGHLRIRTSGKSGVKGVPFSVEIFCVMSHIAGSFGPTAELPELEEQFQCVRLGVFRF